MLKDHGFVNIGSRNKGIMWEDLTARAYRDMMVPGSNFKLTKLLSYGQEQTNQHCLYKDEIASNTTVMIQEAEEGKYTPIFFKTIQDYYRQPLTNFKLAVSKLKVSELTDEQLLLLIDQFYFAGGRTYPPMLIGFFAAYLDDYFTKALTESASLEGVELITVKTNLLTSRGLSFTEREDAALSQLAQEVKYNSKCSFVESEDALLTDPTFREKLIKLTESYGWFHMEYAGQPQTVEHYARLILQKATANLNTDLSQAKNEVIKFQDQFFNQYGNDRLRYITNFMQELSFLLDDTKAVTIENHYIVYPILLEISKRVGVKVGDIYMLSLSEFHSGLLEKNINKTLLEERRHCRGLLLDEGTINVYTGNEAKNVAEKYLDVPKVTQTKEVKGLVAYPGYYRGRVSLILNPHDHSKFKEGDVLVTRDGSAEFTYFLQHAGAVVADQGGIVSHAAIVARESKVPTILGTKIATQILKDGDLVEVDALKGIVKILEKK